MMKMKIKIDALLPFAVLFLMLIIFGVATKGQVFNGQNLLNLFSQSVATIIAGLGMIFVASMGGTDITHGSLLAVSAAFAAIVGQSFGAVWMFPVAILIGACSGLLLGTLNAKFKVPSFMASLSMLIAFRAFVNWILNSRVVMVPEEITFIDENSFKLVALIVMILIIGYLFDFTPFGTYVRAIGENENAVKHAGINVDKIKIIAFIISGIMAAIAGVFTIVRIGGASNNLGSGFEMKVMMAMFIGGIPVQGGMGSKLYKLIVGAPTIILLENGLVLCGASGGITQGIRGVVLLATVYFTLLMYSRFGVKKAARKIGVTEEAN
ncbi:MAG TPA: ABC transporter permease [Clostridiales bacterium]|nr:ABC transporter permease [Clostridiales bacterium]